MSSGRWPGTDCFIGATCAHIAGYLDIRRLANLFSLDVFTPHLLLHAGRLSYHLLADDNSACRDNLLLNHWLLLTEGYCHFPFLEWSGEIVGSTRSTSARLHAC